MRYCITIIMPLRPHMLPAPAHATPLLRIHRQSMAEVSKVFEQDSNLGAAFNEVAGLEKDLSYNWAGYGVLGEDTRRLLCSLQCAHNRNHFYTRVTSCSFARRDRVSVRCFTGLNMPSFLLLHLSLIHI